jgi:hypothetical protein
MDKTLPYLLAALVSTPVFGDESLHIPASLDSISALFSYPPEFRTAQNQPNEITGVLVSASPDGNIIYMLAESRRTDGVLVDGLGEDYPYRVARGISSSGKVSVSVQSASEEIDSTMTFTLSLQHGDKAGVGLYWAVVKNGKTLQAVTNCMGTESQNCSVNHQRFLETVRY